jgi:hypothetical protein
VDFAVIHLSLMCKMNQSAGDIESLIVYIFTFESSEGAWEYQKDRSNYGREASGWERQSCQEEANSLYSLGQLEQVPGKQSAA